MPFTRIKKTTAATGSKIPRPSNKGNAEKQEDFPQAKRSSSPAQGAPKKRTAFVDITNAHKVHISLPGRKKDAKKAIAKKTTSTNTNATSVSAKNADNLKKSSSVSLEDTAEETVLPRSSSVSLEDTAEETVLPRSSSVTSETCSEETDLPASSSEDSSGASSLSVKSDDVSDLLSLSTSEVQVAEEVVVASVEEVVVTAASAPSTGRQLPLHLQRRQVPEEFDIDSQNMDDIFLNPEYAVDIFDYLKEREEKFVLCDYMNMQPNLNTGMRAILVDWLVEVQENFELNHETLYLAVKLTDHYLSLTPVNRESLQLIGSTTMLIASKFEERSPPLMDDFLYICDDAYRREELIAMECSIMQTLKFDINIPIPYRFLRRYAKCVSADMETLTLARYVCELSLQEMDMVPERGSRLASACLLIALVTKDLGGWSPILQFHTGYMVSDLAPVVRKLHRMLRAIPDDKLKAIRSKYAHKVFFQVATLPVVSKDCLERVLLAP